MWIYIPLENRTCCKNIASTFSKKNLCTARKQLYYRPCINFSVSKTRSQHVDLTEGSSYSTFAITKCESVDIFTVCELTCCNISNDDTATAAAAATVVTSYLALHWSTTVTLTHVTDTDSSTNIIFTSDVKTVLFSHLDVRQQNPDISGYPF